ncbi:MAG: Crp/Fnr family transcriptional regulator, partial [Rhodospirillaceae bacterium]
MLSLDDLATARSSPLLAEEPRAVLDGLLSGAAIGIYRNHHRLYRPDQPAEQIYVVLRGKVQIYHGEADGKHAVVAVPQRGDVFGLDEVFETGRRRTAAQAVGECRVLELPTDAYRDAVARHPDMATGLVKLLARSLCSVSDQLARIQLKPKTQRLADYILCLPQAACAQGEVTLPFEKALVAAYLRMEPES